MEQKQKLMDECLAYFKERIVFQKVFAGFKNKYESLGRLGGTVVLKNLSIEEKRQLGGFFQKDYSQNKSVTISMVKLDQALHNSKFAILSWEEILESYFGESLEAKKEK